MHLALDLLRLEIIARARQPLLRLDQVEHRLQPYVMEAAAVYGRGCNHMCM